MEENKEFMSPLEQMNQLLTEKEKVINAKMNELKTYRMELNEFEKQLSQKAAEVKRAQEENALENGRIKKKWEEIKTYEKNLEASMAHIMMEKVELEKRSMSDLENFLDSSNVPLEKNPTAGFDLNALRQSVGIDVPDSGTKDTAIYEESLEEPEQAGMEETVPEIYGAIQQEVLKKFRSPKPYVLEETKQFLCMQIGTKELRVFANGVDERHPQPVIHLIITHKNTRTDTKLQRKLASLGRVLPDWDFETGENQLTCIYYYEKTQDAKSITGKLKECIDKLEE